MDIIIAVSFSLTALGGLVLASLHLGRRRVPLLLALVHGALAAISIGLLFWRVAIGEGLMGLYGASLLMFLGIAALGIFMFIQHGRRQFIPRPLIFIHGSLAIITYGLLMLALFG